MPTTVDSSIWIDYFSGRQTPHVDALRQLIGSNELLLADLVVMEVLRGVADDLEHARTRRELRSVPLRSAASRRVVLRAGENYRFLQKRGFTIRSSIDCMIATFCIEHDVVLLHNDRDFLPFEEYLGLKAMKP